jgi:DNA repair protein RecO (recombination protein O)
MCELLHTLCKGGDWLAAYVRFELDLLACSGFGLDLERCASTGQAHDLLYVSPKSGRAVSRHAGEPYRERLFALPPFLIVTQRNEGVPMPQILDGLRLCGYFLGCRVFEPRGIPVPAVRARFIKVLDTTEGMRVGEVTTQAG